VIRERFNACAESHAGARSSKVRENHDRAARIRGQYRYTGGRLYGLVDSIHLAAAIESGCERLLTNDARLDNFPEITVEILP
jgi:predicted nucleic acid-binding protein